MKRCTVCLKMRRITSRKRWCASCLLIIGRGGGREMNRAKIRIRKGNRCKKCRKKWVMGKRKFDVHHLKGLCGMKSRKYDKDIRYVEYELLCHKCHMNTRHKVRKNTAQVLLNPLKGKTEEIERLKKAGMTLDEIGRQLHVSQSAVWQHLNRRIISQRI